MWLNESDTPTTCRLGTAVFTSSKAFMDATRLNVTLYPDFVTG
jgi:hypothetical protein